MTPAMLTSIFTATPKRDMNSWTAPPPLNKPVPRKVGMSGGCLAFIIILTCFFGFLFGLLALITFISIYKEINLQKRGMEISSEITKKYTLKTKGGETYHIVYRYEPAELKSGFHPFVSSDTYIPESDYYMIHVGQRLKIIYDPREPERSELESRVISGNPFRMLKTLLIIVSGLAAVYSLFVGVTIIIYLRDKWLLQWGNAAAATIIYDREYTTRYGRSSRITYSFRDDKGEVVLGTKSGIPTEEDTRPEFMEYRARYTKNPTVVFNPQKSSRNILFPASAAKLR